MERELYCFMHGLPTKHAGSWMPESNDVLCGETQCRALPAEWERALSAGTHETWEQRCAQECHVCKQHRLKRKRVLSGANDSVVANIKFSDAPLIHPWNAPKYHASLVRARRYARDTNRILLWVVCEDLPIHSDLKTLPEEELNSKRREWARYHDQKTSGVMGLLPLVKNMPLRITATDPRNKNILFKNRRCNLFGWTLHEDDKERLQRCSTPEMKLHHQPKELFVHMENATWVWSKDLGPGVTALSPSTVIWHVDRLKNT